MQLGILGEKVLSSILGLRSDVLAVIVFGSYVYMGRGRDLDIIVVVKDYKKDPFRDSIELRMSLHKKLGYRPYLDIHVLTLEDFRKNLEVGTFLTGLALGYKILYDNTGYIEELIIEFLKRIADTGYTLINKYGEWRLHKHARILLKKLEQHKKTSIQLWYRE